MTEENTSAGPAWTAGPWQIFTTPDGQKLIGIGDAEAGGIAHPNYSLWRDGPEREANAHLISAAPDLAEALEAFLALKQWENGCATPGKPTDDELDAIVALYRAKTAMAKARGERS